MRFVIERAAGPAARFGPDAFASQIGKLIPMEVAPGRYQQATLYAAEVGEDGAKVRLKFETPGTGQARAVFDTGLSSDSVSFGP